MLKIQGFSLKSVFSQPMRPLSSAWQKLAQLVSQRFGSQKSALRNAVHKVGNLVGNSALMVKLRHWHNGLQPREKLLVNSAGIILVIYLAYFIVLSPIGYMVSSIEKDFKAAKTDLLWLQEQAKVARAYQSTGLVSLNEQQLINRSRSIFQKHGLEVKVNGIRENQDFIISLEYRGDNASGFFSGLSEITSLGVLVSTLEFERIRNKVIGMKANLIY